MPAYDHTLAYADIRKGYEKHTWCTFQLRWHTSVYLVIGRGEFISAYASIKYIVGSFPPYSSVVDRVKKRQLFYNTNVILTSLLNEIEDTGQRQLAKNIFLQTSLNQGVQFGYETVHSKKVVLLIRYLEVHIRYAHIAHTLAYAIHTVINATLTDRRQ